MGHHRSSATEEERQDFRLRGLAEVDRKLLNSYQNRLPLTPRPYATMAEELGVSEEEVLSRLAHLKESGIISRVGVVFRPHSVGTSTLAAMRVPPEELERVAALINRFVEVNHNYEREHDLNLWFVLTCPSHARLAEVLREMEEKTGLKVLSLPMVRDYHIDLGFALNWS